MLFRRHWTRSPKDLISMLFQAALNTIAKWVWFQCCFRWRWTRSPNESDFNVVSGGVEHVRQMSLISMLFQAALNTFAKWVWFQCCSGGIEHVRRMSLISMLFRRHWTRSPNESDFDAVSDGVEHDRQMSLIDFNAVSGGVEHVRAAVGVGAEPEPESVAAWPAAEPLLCWRPRGWCPLRPGESGPLYCRLLSDVVYCT